MREDNDANFWLVGGVAIDDLSGNTRATTACPDPGGASK